jgi:hypothetical protein
MTSFFLDNALQMKLKDGKEIISYDWFESEFLTDVERIINIINKVFQNMKEYIPKTGVVETNPYGKTKKELKFEKYLGQWVKKTEDTFDKLEKEHFKKKHDAKFKTKQHRIYLGLTT